MGAGVAVIDLATGAAYGLNADSIFRAASVNKMPILIALYQRAARGSVNLDQTLTLGDDDIQHYGTGLIQDSGAARTYSLRELAALMIETSDNTAAYVLERYLGQASIQDALAHWNVAHTSMADNTTTPTDAVALFAGLYRQQLLPAPSTNIALALLQHTVFDDRLANGVPSGIARCSHAWLADWCTSVAIRLLTQTFASTIMEDRVAAPAPLRRPRHRAARPR